MLKNDVKNINSECQVVIFNWKNNIVSERFSISELTDSDPIDISKYVQEVSFTKNIGDPAGTFEITLPNDRDWKEILQRGAWGIIYMSQDGGLSIPTSDQVNKDSIVHTESTDSILAELDLMVRQDLGQAASNSDSFDGIDIPNINLLKQQKNKIRGIIFIERVTAKGTIGGERGEFDVEFAVTGRDFGVAYLENEIWYNRLYAEGAIQEAAAGELSISENRNVTDLLTTLHKAFFSPLDLHITLEGDSIAKSVPLQWLLPQKLFQALNITPRNPAMATYFGNIPDLLNFEDTFCSFPAENPMTLINGKAWDRLKAHSIEPFHELFVETDDEGNPKLNFRYIPWKITTGKSLGKLNDLVTALIDVDRVTVPAIDILEFDLGEDTHSRFNYFLTMPDTALVSSNNFLPDIKDKDPSTGFPRIQKNSIRRYGLRLMFTTVNAIIQLGSEKADPELLVLHNELMLEYWNNSVFLESGSMTIIGNNEIKVGKALGIEDGAPYNGGKVFYIEAYTDRFVSDEKGAGIWTQNLTLTRGMYPGNVGRRGEPHEDVGEFTEKK